MLLEIWQQNNKAFDLSVRPPKEGFRNVQGLNKGLVRVKGSERAGKGVELSTVKFRVQRPRFSHLA